MRAWLGKKWCELLGVLTLGKMHGGRIERDDQGRINWRCSTCGRWSDFPVSHEDERRLVDRELARDQLSR